jgi:hypothetical protein
MITTLDIIDKVYQVLQQSQLKTMITGKIYKVRRPAGSLLEDVVINSLPVSNTAIQTCILNVNIHVQNKPVQSDSAIDNTLPDYERLAILSEKAMADLSDKWDSVSNFDVQQQNIIEDGDSHYSNIRIEFFKINTV